MHSPFVLTRWTLFMGALCASLTLAGCGDSSTVDTDGGQDGATRQDAGDTGVTACVRTADCDDGNECTEDACGPAGTCANSPSACDGGVDAGMEPRDGGTGDAGVSADGGGTDDGGTDGGGTDAGGDTGPECECAPSEVQMIDCGTCGQQTRSCSPSCQWGGFGGCMDTNARCGGAAPYCRNDFCWGYTYSVTGGSECIDFGFDHLPGDASRMGEADIEVYGRPGATWVKQNRHTSCGGDWADGESGTLDGSGRDTDPSVAWGATDCTNPTLGQFSSRVRIVDGGDSFVLPVEYTHNFYNSSCGADRNSCGTVFDYCSF